MEEINEQEKIENLNKENRITIKSLFTNYSGNYVPSEIDWGLDQGKEILL